MVTNFASHSGVSKHKSLVERVIHKLRNRNFSHISSIQELRIAKALQEYAQRGILVNIHPKMRRKDVLEIEKYMSNITSS